MENKVIAKTTAGTETASSSPLVLGRTGEWWDTFLIWSLAGAAIAAAVVVASTAGSILAHKREAEASDRELDKYKVETQGKVADAKQEGIAAGKTAGDALLRAAELEKEAVEAQERIAKISKEAAQLAADADASKVEIAKATARALEAQLALERFKAPRTISATSLPATMIALKPFAGTDVGLFILDGVEPTNFAGDIAHALSLAGWKPLSWRWNVNIAATGVVVTTKPDSDAAVANAASALVEALRAAGVDAAFARWPSEWKDYGVVVGPPFDVNIPIRVIVGAKPQ